MKFYATLMASRFVTIILALIVMSCSNESARMKKLQATNDSLKMVIRQDKDVRASLREVTDIVLSMRIGGYKRQASFTPEETVTHMRAVRDYIILHREEMEAVKNELNGTISSNQKISAQVNNLKKDLESREGELLMMDEMMVLSLNQNTNLIHVVDLQRIEIDDKLNRLNRNNAEIERLRSNASLLGTPQWIHQPLVFAGVNHQLNKH